MITRKAASRRVLVFSMFIFRHHHHLNFHRDRRERAPGREKTYPGCGMMLRARASAGPAALRETWCRRLPGKPEPMWRWRRSASSWKRAAARIHALLERLYRCEFEPLRRGKSRGRDQLVASARCNRRGVSAMCSRASRQPEQDFKCSDSRMELRRQFRPRWNPLGGSFTSGTPRFYIQNSWFQLFLSALAELRPGFRTGTGSTAIHIHQAGARTEQPDFYRIHVEIEDFR